MIKEKKKYPWWHILFHQWDVRGPFRKCLICKKRQYKVFLDSGILSEWFDLD